MKSKILLLSVCVLLPVLPMACEPEDVSEFQEYMSDPNSDVQVAAEQIGEAIKPLQVLVQTTSGFPYAKTILAGLAVVQLAIGLILSWRKKAVATQLAEVIKGGEIFKKTADDKAVKQFQTAQDEAQTVQTTIAINKLREKIS